MAYNNGKITAPVSIRDVQQALGVSSTDLKTLCISPNINPWARYKPILIPYKNNGGSETTYEGRGPQPITDAVRAGRNWGIKTKYAFDGTTWDTLTAFFSGLTDRLSIAQVDAIAENGWIVNQETPNYWFARLTDFVHTNDNGGIHSDNDGYYHKATAYPTIVHEQLGGSNRTWQMGLPVFPVNAREINVMDGSLFRRAIPDDYDFLARFAYSVETPTSANDYTDFYNDSPGSVSVFEAIQSENGGIQLIKTEVQGGTSGNLKYPNARRGIMIAKANTYSDRYDLIMATIRDNVATSNGSIRGWKEDDLYYNNFRVQRSMGAYTVLGTGETRTLADWGYNSIEELMAESERQCRWLLFGGYNSSTNPMGGSGTNPNIKDQNGNVVSNLYGNGSETDSRKRILKRGMTAFHSAIYPYNDVSGYFWGKYLDLTWGGMNGMFRIPLYDSSVTGYDAEPEDYLSGELLVIEFYMRVVEIQGHRTISPFTVIPGYSYKIQINRTPSGTYGTLDGADISFGLYIESGSDGFGINLITSDYYTTCLAALRGCGFTSLTATIKNGSTTIQTITLLNASGIGSGVVDGNDGNYNTLFYSFAGSQTYTSIVLTCTATTRVGNPSKTFTL